MNERGRPRAVSWVALALVTLVAIVVGGIALAGSGDEESTTTSPPAEAPSGSAIPSQGALPPGITECLADQGFDLESPDDLHSAVPQKVIDECFNALHQGGGAP
jgi:hypothetical protein